MTLAQFLFGCGQPGQRPRRAPAWCPSLLPLPGAPAWCPNLFATILPDWSDIASTVSKSAHRQALAPNQFAIHPGVCIPSACLGTALPVGTCIGTPRRRKRERKQQILQPLCAMLLPCKVIQKRSSNNFGALAGRFSSNFQKFLHSYLDVYSQI